MRASKYFPNNELLSLEFALFTDLVQENTKYQYCLINESARCFYIGESVSVASIIARLRLLVKGAAYPLLAHQVQGSAMTSQMADWVLAVFKPGEDMVGIANIMENKGFEQYQREAPYGANSIESIQLYSATHRPRGYQFYFTSVKEPTAYSIMRNARHHMASSMNKLMADPQLEKVHTARIIKRINDHTYAKEWSVHNVPMREMSELREVRKYVSGLNADLLQHFVKNIMN